MAEQDIPLTLLVIAQSARMLVQMAVGAGFSAVAIDCYADSDTLQLALEAIKVESLRLNEVRPALDAVQVKHGLTHVVYGSGFEDHLETLGFLQQNWVVLGNSVEVFRQIQDKPAFFARLAALSILYPQTIFTPPSGERRQWLLKPVSGAGGAHIRWHDPNDSVCADKFYWQRFVRGEALSMLFLAAEGRIGIVGFNRQWICSVGHEKQPFLFAGIASHANVSDDHRRLLYEWLTKLARVYPLRGLGSLDFMLADGYCYVLEINARIPASAQLYGKRVFSLHLQACLGVMTDDSIESEPAAYQVVYAKQAVKIPVSVDWPDWALDRPSGGAIVGMGQPICSIIAAGKSPGQAEECLCHRQQVIENILNIGF
ncbi:ATP-grasp domain-containing protein [Methylomonas rapida]|uniref:ATP-grasp domain-containing protein n=1 Tax=Methylomonas rapida TaxID=2963939 RepID=A0ABY7GH89_9GAMM|nr:ATP-grasp domain-containing protein [Methylomonas rapida]WAR43525.1 ATP-grasp domain-containing protein [Methylomonas rapida]